MQNQIKFQTLCVKTENMGKCFSNGFTNDIPSFIKNALELDFNNISYEEQTDEWGIAMIAPNRYIYTDKIGVQSNTELIRSNDYIYQIWKQ